MTSRLAVMGETHRQVLAALSVGDQLRVRPGRSLMSMNVCLLFVPVTTEKHVNYCSKLMLILYRPITAHRRYVLDIGLWCRRCNKIKCHRGKTDEWILTMFVLLESNASVTELFIGLTIKFSIQRSSNALRFDDNFHLLKYTNKAFISR